MNLWLDFALSVRALEAHKGRTALTALGVAIGVGAIVTVVALGRRAQDQLAGQIQAAGTRMAVGAHSRENSGTVSREGPDADGGWRSGRCTCGHGGLSRCDGSGGLADIRVGGCHHARTGCRRGNGGVFWLVPSSESRITQPG